MLTTANHFFSISCVFLLESFFFIKEEAAFCCTEDIFRKYKKVRLFFHYRIVFASREGNLEKQAEGGSCFEGNKKHPRTNQSQNTSGPRNIEENNTQVSEEFESKVTGKLSQVFSRTGSRIFVALSKLDKLLLNPLIPTLSGFFLRSFQNIEIGNQEPFRDRSPNDPHPEVEIFSCRTSNFIDSGPEAISQMVTGVYEKIPCCSPGTASGKQKKAHCTS